MEANWNLWGGLCCISRNPTALQMGRSGRGRLARTVLSVQPVRQLSKSAFLLQHSTDKPGPSLTDHLRGRRHLRLCEERDRRQQQQERSVYVSGFPRGTTEEQLMDIFQEISSVKSIVMDKDRGLYAIVEFDSIDGVSTTLSEAQIKLGGQRLKVKPREKKAFQRKKGGAPRNLQPPNPEVLSKKLLHCTDVNDQMSSVVSLCSPAHHETHLRQLLLSLLQESFTEFFPGCQLLPFGSSVNGFQISGCDLDLYLDLGEDKELEMEQSKIEEDERRAEGGEGEKAGAEENRSKGGDEVGGEDIDMEPDDEKKEQDDEKKDRKDKSINPGEENEKEVQEAEVRSDKWEKREKRKSTEEEERAEEPMSSGEESEEDEDEEEDITPGLSLKGASPEEVLEVVGRVLRNCVPGVHGVQSVSSARRPVIRFQHKTSGLRGDITLNNRLALRNSYYLRLCSDLDPRVPQLVYTIRYWARVHQLAGNPLGGGPLVNNYALTLLVISFLQTRSPPVIPTLSQMRKEAAKEPPHVIDGWDCSFPSDPTHLQASENQQSLSSLLSEFFFFFSSLDLSSLLLSTCDGLILPLPLSSPVPTWSAVFRLGPLNIQDPFELSHNVCGNVSNRTARRFFAQCTAAARTCRSPLYQSPSSSRHWGVILILLPAACEGEKEVKRDAELSIPLGGGSLDGVCSAVRRVLVDVLLCTYEEIEFDKESGGKVGEGEEVLLSRRGSEDQASEERETLENEAEQEVLGKEEHLTGEGTSTERKVKNGDWEMGESDGKKRDREECNQETVKKKRRIECSRDVLSDHTVSEMLGQENSQGVEKPTQKDTNEQCRTSWGLCVWHRVWVGRRKQRRSLRRVDMQGEKLETAVSHALASEDGRNKSSKPLINMEVKAQLTSEGHVKLGLTPKSDPHGLCPEFSHFLGGFLPRMVREMLQGVCNEVDMLKGE